jgi:hypothetical protein
MSKGIEAAVQKVFGDLPHDVCHFHFLSAVGVLLFDLPDKSRGMSYPTGLVWQGSFYKDRTKVVYPLMARKRGSKAEKNNPRQSFIAQKMFTVYSMY